MIEKKTNSSELAFLDFIFYKSGENTDNTARPIRTGHLIFSASSKVIN
jgi:hypothetical protein